MRYEKLGISLGYHVPNTNYIVRANVLRKDKFKFDVTLELREKTVGRWDMLDEQVYSLTSDNPNVDTTKLVEEKIKEGFFDEFIEKYEYELKCFDKGFEVMEGLND